MVVSRQRLRSGPVDPRAPAPSAIEEVAIKIIGPAFANVNDKFQELDLVCGFIQIAIFNGHNLAAMGLGCLIKVTTSPVGGAGLATIAYVVSEQDAHRAVNIIKSKIARPADEVVAVSRVSEELLNALGVAPGDFTRADGRPS